MRLMEALASVESKTGENYCSPENCGPDANRSAQEPRDDDSEQDACVDANSCVPASPLRFVDQAIAGAEHSKNERPGGLAWS